MDSKSLIQEIRSMLKFDDAVSVEMASATLTDGTVIKWEGELVVGTAILVETAEGDIPAPDGTHEVEGGTLVTTVGGVVSEIVEPSPEVEVEIEASQEFATIEKFNEVVSNLENRIAELTAQFESVVAKLEKQSEAFSKTVDLVEKVANLPSAEPTKAPEQLSKKEQQFANIVKIAQQLKNK
jgi:uncharacterized coiled-coil protein SlyX